LAVPTPKSTVFRVLHFASEVPESLFARIYNESEVFEPVGDASPFASVLPEPICELFGQIFFK
jgi:hypothetical protein